MNSSYPWGSSPATSRKSNDPSGRAMKPSRLVPTNTEAFTSRQPRAAVWTGGGVDHHAPVASTEARPRQLVAGRAPRRGDDLGSAEHGHGGEQVAHQRRAGHGDHHDGAGDRGDRPPQPVCPALAKLELLHDDPLFGGERRRGWKQSLSPPAAQVAVAEHQGPDHGPPPGDVAQGDGHESDALGWG